LFKREQYALAFQIDQIRSNQIKSISQPKSYNSNLPIAGVDLIISKFVLLYLISSVTINNNDRQAI